MKRTGTILILAGLMVILQSCGGLFPTGRSRSAENDSTDTIVNTSIVGTSNTPGSSRTGYYGLPLEATISTANTTGPSPSSDDVTTSALSFETQRFIRLVSYNRITEVQLSQYAITRSLSPAIKTYASGLVTMQNRMGDTLRTIATFTDTTVFDLDQSAGDELPEKLAKLNQEQDSKFDETYKKMIIKELRSAIKILEQGSKFKDLSIAEFSRKHLPELNAQLKNINSLK